MKEQKGSVVRTFPVFLVMCLPEGRHRLITCWRAAGGEPATESDAFIIGARCAVIVPLHRSALPLQFLFPLPLLPLFFSVICNALNHFKFSFDPVFHVPLLIFFFLICLLPRFPVLPCLAFPHLSLGATFIYYTSSLCKYKSLYRLHYIRQGMQKR